MYVSFLPSSLTESSWSLCIHDVILHCSNCFKKQKDYVMYNAHKELI